MTRCTLIFICVLLLASVASVVSAAGQPAALVLYDGEAQKSQEGLVDGTHIANLLGHFGYRGTLKSIESYRSGGMSGYNAVFVVGGSNKTVWPAAVLRDVATGGPRAYRFDGQSFGGSIIPVAISKCNFRHVQ